MRQVPYVPLEASDSDSPSSGGPGQPDEEPRAFAAGEERGTDLQRRRGGAAGAQLPALTAWHGSRASWTSFGASPAAQPQEITQRRWQKSRLKRSSRVQISLPPLKAKCGQRHTVCDGRRGHIWQGKPLTDSSPGRREPQHPALPPIQLIWASPVGTGWTLLSSAGGG